MELFRILAAVLHLGNVNIQASGRAGDRSYIDVKSFCIMYNVSPCDCHLSSDSPEHFPPYIGNVAPICLPVHVPKFCVFFKAEDRSLAVFAKLLGVEGSQMAHWLCHRRLAVGGELLVKPMTGQQAVDARDALAKHIYGQLFTWTVQRLNSALRTQAARAKSFIGVLDIYG